jgi:glycosyltransferase involved in cell wall biosynthesis
MNLGVYISTLNEDVLIAAALKNLMKVFPQVEVIDLGSTDKTLEIVRRLNVPINEHHFKPQSSKYSFDAAGQQWIILKNAYADKHDWILMLDGDEIFDEENLLKLKAKVGIEKPFPGYNIGWKIVRKTQTHIQQSNIIISGPKLYKTSEYVFQRGWPGEILCRSSINSDGTRTISRRRSFKNPRLMCDVWCWHGVLLNRSTKPEATARMKKRMEKEIYYNTTLQWENVDKWPWE